MPHYYYYYYYYYTVNNVGDTRMILLSKLVDRDRVHARKEQQKRKKEKKKQTLVNFAKQDSNVAIFAATIILIG